MGPVGLGLGVGVEMTTAADDVAVATAVDEG
jgi:hypothetical protein